MDPRNIRKAIWEGSIPCRIDLDPAECRSFEGLEPYFISIPRVSYLPLHIGIIHRFFEDYMKDPTQCQPNSAWFEFENVPLKWHWPVGVLYDYTTGFDPLSIQHSKHMARNNNDDDDFKLPWSLTLRFRGFPTKTLMRLDVPNACRDAWMNTAKEADHVRNGTAKNIMDLQVSETAALWEGIKTHDFTKFWSVNEKLLTPPSGPIKFIPLRLYIPTTPRVIQVPLSPYVEGTDKELQTLGMVLNKIVPEIFPSRRAPILARPVVHGAVVPWNTPVLDLMRAAVFPDGFLHVTIAMAQ